MLQSKSPVLEPQTQALIDALAAQGGEPLYKLSYPAARKVLEDLQAAPVAKLPADVEEKVLPVGPTGEVPVRGFIFDVETGLIREVERVSQETAA